MTDTPDTPQIPDEKLPMKVLDGPMIILNAVAIALHEQQVAGALTQETEDAISARAGELMTAMMAGKMIVVRRDGTPAEIRDATPDEVDTLKPLSSINRRKTLEI